MTTMVAELYDALREAGASDASARKAAEALANYDNRFDRLERRIDELDHKLDLTAAALDRKIDASFAALDQKLERLRGELSLLKWMFGALIALILPMFLKLFLH